MDDYDNELNERMDRILTATANALHGGPHPGGLHSWHDLPELVEQLRKERDEARRMLCEDWAKQDGLPLDWQGRRGAEGMAEFVGWDCFKENTND